MSYSGARKRAEPYTKTIELPQMRRARVEQVKTAVIENRHAYVLINNRSEGKAPLTRKPCQICSAVRSPSFSSLRRNTSDPTHSAF